jgi:hypothetical protein
MEEHWLAGREDVERTFNHPAWKNRTRPEEGVKVLDLTRESRLIHAESAASPPRIVRQAPQQRPAQARVACCPQARRQAPTKRFAGLRRFSCCLCMLWW